MYFAGFVQITGAVLLWIHRLEILGLLGLWSIISVALATHLRLGHDATLFLPGVFVGSLVLWRASSLFSKRQGVEAAMNGELSAVTSDERAAHPSQATPVCPEGFTDRPFQIQYQIGAPLSRVVSLLNATSTFTDGQIFPFRVEFLDPGSGALTQRFEQGVLTNHHGPLLSAAGILSQIDGLKYRRLDYFYGSYAISFRLFRPYCLEIWFDPISPDSTRVTAKLSTHCRQGWGWLWSFGQNLFWPQFGWSIRLALFLKKYKRVNAASSL